MKVSIQLVLKKTKAIHQKIQQNFVTILHQEQKGKDKKIVTYESAHALYEGQESTLNAFKSRAFPIKATQRLRKLTPEQMLQRYPIALAQVKSGKNLKVY